MDKTHKVQMLSELFDLLNMYYEERDLPNGENDFFGKVEACCQALELDYTEFKKIFGLGLL